MNTDRRVLVCQEISCPYWSGSSRNYGCQRWRNSAECHLNQIADLDSRQESALYANLSQEAIDGLKVQNDRFFAEDPKHQRDLKINELL